MLVSFLGGIILFLYGQNVLETSLEKTGRLQLVSILSVLARHRFAALILGSIFSIGMQSSTAAVLTLVSLVNSGFLHLKQAIGLVLGASLGTTLVVQLLSFDISGYALWFIIAGFVISRMLFYAGYPKNEFLIGLGFIFYGLYLLQRGLPSDPDVIKGFLEIFCATPSFIFIAGFLLAVICQSTLLPLAMGIVLMREGSLTLLSAIPIILGAHAGAGVLPFLSSLRILGNSTARQLALFNIIFRIFGSALFLPLLVPLSLLTSRIAALFMPGRELANAHTIFTLTTVCLFLPFVNRFAGLMERLHPEERLDKRILTYLCPELRERKEILLAGEKEIIKMIERMEGVLVRSLCIWEGESMVRVRKLEREYDFFYRLTDCISRYIARIPDEEDDKRRKMQILGITDNLGKMAWLVTKNLTDIATRRLTSALSFSIEGLNELLNIHKKVINEFRLLKSKKAKDIFLMDKELNLIIERSHDAHYERIHKGFFDTQKTSLLHLDAITVLERIHNHIQKIAGLL